MSTSVRFADEADADFADLEDFEDLRAIIAGAHCRQPVAILVQEHMHKSTSRLIQTPREVSLVRGSLNLSCFML